MSIRSSMTDIPADRYDLAFPKQERSKQSEKGIMTSRSEAPIKTDPIHWVKRYADLREQSNMETAIPLLIEEAIVTALASRECEWTDDSMDNDGTAWLTQCGVNFVYENDLNREENGQIFCHHCGCRIIVKH